MNIYIYIYITRYVNGMMVKNGSRYLDYQFGKRKYNVKCVAFYDIKIDNCSCYQTSSITVFGKNL